MGGQKEKSRPKWRLILILADGRSTGGNSLLSLNCQPNYFSHSKIANLARFMQRKKVVANGTFLVFFDKTVPTGAFWHLFSSGSYYNKQDPAVLQSNTLCAADHKIEFTAHA